MYTEEIEWDLELNPGVHHNGERRDLNYNQKRIPFVLFRSERIERTKERISVWGIQKRFDHCMFKCSSECA